MIELQNISVVFNQGKPLEKHALQDINLVLQPGEWITLVGGNGAGKSTLMRVIAGEIFPTKGKIIIDKKDVTHFNVKQRAAYISRVFQNPMQGTCDMLTIAENLAISANRIKKRKFTFAINSHMQNEFKKRMHHFGLNLENRLQENIGQLSGGQRQALSLLMATMAPAKLLLLDEHTAALDKKTEAIILDMTKQLINESQLATLMITHNLQHALELGGRLLIMQEGKIVADIHANEKLNLDVSALLKIL